jgi:N-acetylneuraminic acid mutarotase
MHRIILLVFASTILLVVLFVEPASAGVGVENTWTTKAPMHQARGLVGVAVVEDKIYAIGGYNATSSFANETFLSGTTEEYDPATNAWVYKTSMPTPMDMFATAVYKDKIYCFYGGLTRYGTSPLTQVYDPATDTWENSTAIPTSREGIQANVLGDKIYIVGGVVFNGSYTNYQYLAINEAYDPQTDTWSTKAPLPNPTSNYASAVFNGKLYIFGGTAYKSNITQIYDPTTDSWSIGEPSVYSTTYYIAGATTGVNAPPKIYLFYAGLHPMRGSATPGQMYDPVSDSWTEGLVKPTFRESYGLAVVDDLIYAIGGYDFKEDMFTHEIITTPFALNEVFTPFGYGTVHVTPSPTPVPTEILEPTATTTQITNNEQIQATAIVAAAAAVAVGVGVVVYFKRLRH